MSENELYTAIGLMSGTSLDGSIDVALIETDGRDYVRPLGFYAHPYGADERNVVRACFGRREVDAQTQEAERLVTDIHIAAVKESGFTADIIGFHGQTITHDPAAGLTWQLGDGARMAAETGIDVVCDFRRADVAAGGQGAPLAPLYHAAIMAGQEMPLAVLNLGGVANVSYIAPYRHSGESRNLHLQNEKIPACAGMTDNLDILAFDCGPGNALMDDYMAAHMGREFDADGAIAQSGTADQRVVDAFLTHDYFRQSPPKSLDRNDFESVMAQLPDDSADAMASLAAMSVAGVAAACDHFPAPPRAWYVCGGGRKNAYLMRLLVDALGGHVYPIEKAGYDGDAIEAQAFAYLAVRSVLGLPLSLPETTGVAEPMCGGFIHPVQASRA